MKSRSMFHLVSLLVMLSSLLGSAATPIPVSADVPAGLSASDWGQIQALLTPAQQAYIKASNSGADDNFGKVAIDGDTLVIGASGESSNATGINGNQLDNSASSAGAVYVFVRSGNTWSQQAYIKASNTDANDYFGSSIAIAGDTIVVGAYGEDSNATGINGNETNNSAADSGAVYVFTRTGSTWSQQAYIKASNTNAADWFGGPVAISEDTIVVGARGEDSLAIGVNGDQTNNINPDSGAAYVFTRTGSTWSQQAYIKASNANGGGFDYFGFPVAISGDTLVVGAFFEDSNAIGVNGDQTNDLSPDSGAAYVFTRMGSIWSQQAYIKASNTDAGDRFGNSLAISGDTLVVGAWQEDSNATGINGNQGDNSATDSGAAYVFTRAGSNWSQQAYVKASNTEIYDYFGMPIALSGDVLLIGSDEDSNAIGVNGNQADNSAVDSGAVYAFQRTGTNWSQDAYMKASNTETGDFFGSTITLSGNTIVVGADWESSNATGVNGNQADNSASASGAVYAFAFPRTVTFNANGGTGTMSDQSAIIPTALTTNAFTRSGYSFSGWNTAADGSGTGYANSAIYDFSADVTLYAQWIAPSFSDVPLDYWAWKYIESLYNSGITGGCSTNPLNYCPTQSVTRAQMAVFLLKGIHGSSFAPPAVNGSTGFNDVAVDYWAAAWIKQLAAEGITGGCGNGDYCPDNTVTRDQMAVFLLKAEHGSSYAPPAVNGDTGFTDVPADYWAAAWIKQLAAEAITGGCGGGVYCPTNAVTRDQMAVFLQKTFNLPLP